MLSTSLFHVKISELPSSKNERGIAAADIWPSGLLVNEVVVPIADIEAETCCTALVDMFPSVGDHRVSISTPD